MRESLQLFHDIAHNPVFAHAAFALFFNKRDLFAAKLPRVPLSVCFAQYTGKSEQEAEQFIVAQFDAQMPAARLQDGRVYRYTTCATDTNQMAVVWRALMDVYYRSVMQKAGF